MVGVVLLMTDVIQIANLMLLVLSVGLAAISVRKLRNSRGVDFILQAEGAVDPLHYGLVGAEPEIIRSVYRAFDLDLLDDADCRDFPFMYSIYTHASRMHYIMSAKRFDYGLSAFQREETKRAWTNDLLLFIDHPAMKTVHQHALRLRNYNSSFLQLAEELFASAEGRATTTAAPPHRLAPSIREPFARLASLFGRLPRLPKSRRK